MSNDGVLPPGVVSRPGCEAKAVNLTGMDYSCVTTNRNRWEVKL